MTAIVKNDSSNITSVNTGNANAIPTTVSLNNSLELHDELGRRKTADDMHLISQDNDHSEFVERSVASISPSTTPVTSITSVCSSLLPCGSVSHSFSTVVCTSASVNTMATSTVLILSTPTIQASSISSTATSVSPVSKGSTTELLYTSASSSSIPIFTSDGLATSTINTSVSNSAPSTGGLFSRLSKTLEHKIHEIRHEKFPPRDKIEFNQSLEESKNFVADTLINLDCKTSTAKVSESSSSLSSSPSKKTSIAQEITELSSELGRNIPKLSELRNRKNAAKDFSNRSRSTLNSLLGRDDGVPLDDFLPEEESVEAGVEAEEGVLFTSSSVSDSIAVSYIHNQEASCIDQASILSSTAIPQPDDPSDTHNKLAATESIPSRKRKAQQESFSIYKYYKTTLDNISFAIHNCSVLSSNTNKWWLGVLIVCFLVPIPSFLSGFIFGSSLIGCVAMLLLKLLTPNKEAERHKRRPQRPLLLDIGAEQESKHYKASTFF